VREQLLGVFDSHDFRGIFIIYGQCFGWRCGEHICLDARGQCMYTDAPECALCFGHIIASKRQGQSATSRWCESCKYMDGNSRPGPQRLYVFN
jgi:hypothetical protein